MIAATLTILPMRLTAGADCCYNHAIIYKDDDGYEIRFYDDTGSYR